jgi:hypothetical protein
VKILIITVIALIVPAFFLLVFVMGTCGNLSALRRRCRQLAAPGDAAAPPGQGIGDTAYRDAIARYDAARSAFPARLIAALFGFGPVDRTVTARPPESHC